MGKVSILVDRFSPRLIIANYMASFKELRLDTITGGTECVQPFSAFRIQLLLQQRPHWPGL